jgi:hypothetical protein
MPQNDDRQDSETVDLSLKTTGNARSERTQPTIEILESPSFPTAFQQPHTLQLQLPMEEIPLKSTPSPRPSALSRQNTSQYPPGDFRNQTLEEINDIKCEVMVNWLHSQQEERVWIAGGRGEGVVLKKSKGVYTSSPTALETEIDGLLSAIQDMNIKV